jgi:general secretion pathway protein D
VTSFLSVTGGGTGGVTAPVQSFQYQDVGIKIEVEPRVHHNKEITLKLQLEVSQLAGNAPGTTQPIIGTRTVAANIRLKDGETNFLAGLYRRDRARIVKTIPFIGDIPILGRLFTYEDRDRKTTDLVLTLTPHILRIPDVTEEDLAPVYVGTDANISYQGTPRVENPTGDRGPFDQGRPAPVPRQPAPAPVPTPASPAVPGIGPSDIFRPPTTPPPSPHQVVPPQGAAKPQSQSSEAQTAEVSAGTMAVLLDFDPAYVALAYGQQQSILVRATASAGFPGGTFAIRFDSAVVAAVFARPILGGDGGVAKASIEAGRVVLEIPGSAELTGTRAVAEITLRGISTGRTTLSFEPAEMTGASATFSSSVVDVR